MVLRRRVSDGARIVDDVGDEELIRFNVKAVRVALAGIPCETTPRAADALASKGRAARRSSAARAPYGGTASTRSASKRSPTSFEWAA